MRCRWQRVFVSLLGITLLVMARVACGQGYANSPFGTPAFGNSPFGAPAFGNSPFGYPTMSNMPSLGSGSGTGGMSTLRGNERFIRGNRRSGDFVGNGMRNRSHFIGSQQGTVGSHVESATSGLHVAASTNVNQPAASELTASGTYQPALEIGFELPNRAEKVSSELTRHLQASPAIRQGSRIAVSVEGRTAILRGEVVSESDRALAEQLVLFEPGISAVRNDLQVKRPASKAGASLPYLPATPADRH